MQELQRIVSLSLLNCAHISIKQAGSKITLGNGWEHGMNLPTSSLKEFYKVNVQLCYPFVQAVLDTLNAQGSISGKMGKPFFKAGTLPDSTDIAISTFITSNDHMSCLVFSFSRPVFLAVMGRMFGQVYTALTPELEDGAKEFINIVFNKAKKTIAGKGISAVRSIPQVIFAEGMKISYLTRGQTVALPLETEVGTITVEITTQDVSLSDEI